MKTAVVTGAARGIGFELCKQLKEKGYTVVALCRSSSEPLKKLDVKVVEGVDVASDDVSKLTRELKTTKIDLLINNAGIFLDDRLGELDFKSIREQFEVNTLGPLKITEALLPNMTANSTVAMITSLMGSIEDNGSGAYYGYRMSKAALNMAGMSLARDLQRDSQKRNITVLLLHPGYVSTDMTDHRGTVEPRDSVKGLLQVIETTKQPDQAKFISYQGKELPW